MAMEAGEPSLNLLVYICLSIFLYGAQLHLYLSLALTSSIFLQVLTDVEKVAG
jgi:membrane-anchored glycerophosphoryl diester phosphodiesterase (GDPDase)